MSGRDEVGKAEEKWQEKCEFEESNPLPLSFTMHL